jgi:hypothetical protein
MSSPSSVHTIDLSGVKQYCARPFHITHRGWDISPTGTKIGFTDYYMTINGKPVFGVAGECHFSRLDPSQWDSQCAKMKEAGVTIVSTYVFWNHHEEYKGIWNFTGRRNLRRFIQTCARHSLMVIVRIGPFDHGEARNGGIPDWVFSEPCEARSTDPVFMKLVHDLYSHIAEQLSGLYWKDGGPIIAAQLDNEYMHSSAPWEFLAGVTEDWVPGGHEGMKYISALRKCAEDVGIAVPFYTNTGWGKAPVPSDVLPLWGGYAYRPWIFYDGTGTHPLTDEYLYRNYHDDHVTRTSEFDPSYPPSSRPYACCEMGGGMVVTYNYRFVLPLVAIDAMANVKIASGCNFVGYYMFSGGSNPTGDGIYLNESQTPKISYDYQAPIGQYGQFRQSARRLRLLHLFATSFASQLVPLLPYVPADQKDIVPSDLTDMRWCVRSDGQRGFIFLNNFQDHASMKPVSNQTLEIHLADHSCVRIHGVGLASGENAILPFNMNLDGITVQAATVQPITMLKGAYGQPSSYVFCIPDGMSQVWMKFAHEQSPRVIPDQPVSQFDVSDGTHAVHIICLKREVAERMTVSRATEDSMADSLVVTCDDQKLASQLSHSAPTIHDGVPVLYHNRAHLRLTGVAGRYSLRLLPGNTVKTVELGCSEKRASEKQDSRESHNSRESHTNCLFAPHVDMLHHDRYIIEIPEEALEFSRTHGLMLAIHYTGDIGWLFAGSRLIDDNFANGDAWCIDLRYYRELIEDCDRKLVLAITPLKKNAKVVIDQAMAARMETSEGQSASLDSLKLIPLFDSEVEI